MPTALPDAPAAPSLDAACAHLLSLQRDDGHWVGELEGDTILESEYILLLAFLGREGEETTKRCARYIERQQRADGSWSNYPDGPYEPSVSVKAYFALKLAGRDPGAPHMAKARACILAHGGAAKVNSFTRFYLALLGQVPYSACPSVPPEMVLLPRWFPVNLSAMSSWTRTIVVPLSIMSALKPRRTLSADKGIRELFRDPPERWGIPRPAKVPLFSWARFFLGVDWTLKRVDWLFGPLRRWAVKRAWRWIEERLEGSDGLGAIFPPMIYTVIVLKALGDADDSPRMREAMRQLEELCITEDGATRLQPCLSPVWDTALSLCALGDAGHTAEEPAIRRAVDWLLAREVKRRGDWSARAPKLAPAGWAFEYRNPHYPDVDDTAAVVMALGRVGAESPAVGRGIAWLLGMQNSDGGWAAFDRDINLALLEKIPFADHNAMLDPSCPDISARVLESLAEHGIRRGHAAVERAIAFILKHQDARGCWAGRWGVNYIYGTWQVLVGLAATGHDMASPPIRRAAAWLESVQQPGGGWGETCGSYDDPSLAGIGEATASQTAWAMMGLMAAGERSHAVEEGIAWLKRTQVDGTWEEEPFTGTGFPKVFYLRYHLYRHYFPLQALARFSRRSGFPA
ncbi:MAG: squalene--hopene cyclase [Gemmataceae bacterium]|nr:squalene--hopene cyclase [Gemmataceae bacterium]